MRPSLRINIFGCLRMAGILSGSYSLNYGDWVIIEIIRNYYSKAVSGLLLYEVGERGVLRRDEVGTYFIRIGDGEERLVTEVRGLRFKVVRKSYHWYEQDDEELVA